MDCMKGLTETLSSTTGDQQAIMFMALFISFLRFAEADALASSKLGGSIAENSGRPSHPVPSNFAWLSILEMWLNASRVGSDVG